MPPLCNTCFHKVIGIKLSEIGIDKNNMKRVQDMNDLIKRLAIITVCIILLAGAVFFIIAEKNREDSVPAAEMSEETETPENGQDTYAETEALKTETASISELKTETVSISETEHSTAPPEESGGSSEDSETSKSRTVITSRVRKEYDNNSVYIDMENVLQLPELPVGCEITALTILLRYCGFDAEKTDLAKNYLPTSWGNARYEDGKTYKDSFFDYFIGDPFSRGYGCFSRAIEKAANAYISDHGGGFTVKNISGSHPDVLYDYLAQGTPVLCWATDGMIEPEYYETWYDNATGEKLDWYLNEHCFVLAGFNMSADLVTLNDPMKGIIDYNINKFETRYDQMYKQAIVIIPDGSRTEPLRTEAAETAAENEETALEITETSAGITETDPEITETAETSAELFEETDELEDEEEYIGEE